MESRLEYVGTWLGLAKLGIVTALINYNLRLETLAHCINSSHSKALIYSAELADGESWYSCQFSSFTAKKLNYFVVG